MPRKRCSQLERSQVTFGYLFHNMNGLLCFTIGVDNEDTWAVAYKPTDSGTMEWSGADFCPTWWAATHAAKRNLPEADKILPSLVSAMKQRFDNLDSVKNSDTPPT